MAITFDDGFANFLTGALPVLQRLGFPATVFVVAGQCGATNRWDANRLEIPELPLMDWKQLAEVSRAGITVGAHTMSHADLTKLAPAEAEWEISSSCRDLSERLECVIDDFAYPYGASNGVIRAIAGRYFRSACGTQLGFASTPLDRLCLPRIDAYYLRSRGVFRKFSQGGAKSYLTARRLLRGFRSWAAS